MASKQHSPSLSSDEVGMESQDFLSWRVCWRCTFGTFLAIFRENKSFTYAVGVALNNEIFNYHCCLVT
jgi:hypothetical protein